MSGADAAQHSLLKALYRSQRDKRDIICEDYGDYLEECSELKSEKKETPKIEKPKKTEEVSKPEEVKTMKSAKEWGRASNDPRNKS